MNLALSPFEIISRIIFCIHIACIIFVLFFEHRDATKRFVWLILLSFLPGVGIIFYFLFSGNFFTANKRLREVSKYSDSLIKPLLEEQKKYLEQNADIFPNEQIKNNLQLINMNIDHGSSVLTTTQSARIFTSGKDFFDNLCDELENAEKSIYMEYFIFHEDKIGKRIMDILCRKAREGVEVKLIYDDLGSIMTRTRFFKRLDAAGGKARPFFQIRIGLPLTLNYRNHRKCTIIDNSAAFVGGMNIGDEYANQKTRGRHHKLNWRDTTVRLEGNIVFYVKRNFLADWFSLDVGRSRKNSIEQSAQLFPVDVARLMTETLDSKSEFFESASFLDNEFIPSQIITAGPHDTHGARIEDSLIRMIMGAQKRVWIQTPYFTPDEQFCNALKIAAYTGVDVSVMIPSQWDKIYMKAASYNFARRMMDAGIKFYLYPGFIHSKTICVDGKICSIGTTNIDNRSFALHYEQNVIFYDRNFTETCENIFLSDMSVCRRASTAFFDKVNFLVRGARSFCALFAPLM